MESPTHDEMMLRPASRDALYRVRDGMGLSDLVMRFVFWHLDEKRNGKLSGQVDGELAVTSPLQFIERVVEQAQTDLLVGAARKHHAAERAAQRRSVASPSSTRRPLAKRPPVSGTRTAQPPRTHRQEVAYRWKALTAKQNELAENSTGWSTSRTVAMQKSIASAMIAWKRSVDAPGEG